MLRPDLVIFDCDGVLVDSESITHRVIAEQARALGASIEAEEAHTLFVGGSWASVLAEIERRLGAPAPDDFTETFRAALVEALDNEVEAVPGVIPALDAIDAAGIATCVGSNGPQVKMKSTLGRTGLLPRFEGRIYSAYDIDAFKPEPTLYLHAAEAMGVPPERAVVVEDSMNGARAGLAAGMRTLVYVRQSDAPRYEALGAVCLDDMAGLPSLLGIA